MSDFHIIDFFNDYYTLISGGSRIFPGGGANSISGCAYLLFLPKTA